MQYVAFDPNNQTITAFLSALAKGETGGAKNAAVLGVGGTDLSGAPLDEYGFPQWDGWGNSHAAGTFQFQPGTWQEVAREYGLNFQNPTDQAAGAWYYAQQRFTSATGKSLLDTLEAGDYSTVEQALYNAWPSVIGNSAAPGGLGQTLTEGSGTDIYGGGGTARAIGQALGQGLSTSPGGLFIRGALIVVGAVILLVALWQLLSTTGAVPSPGDTAKIAAKVL